MKFLILSAFALLSVAASAAELNRCQPTGGPAYLYLTCELRNGMARDIQTVSYFEKMNAPLLILQAGYATVRVDRYFDKEIGGGFNYNFGGASYTTPDGAARADCPSGPSFANISSGPVTLTCSARYEFTKDND
jgi:hypothetical protein